MRRLAAVARYARLALRPLQTLRPQPQLRAAAVDVEEEVPDVFAHLGALVHVDLVHVDLGVVDGARRVGCPLLDELVPLAVPRRRYQVGGRQVLGLALAVQLDEGFHFEEESLVEGEASGADVDAGDGRTAAEFLVEVVVDGERHGYGEVFEDEFSVGVDRTVLAQEVGVVDGARFGAGVKSGMKD